MDFHECLIKFKKPLNLLYLINNFNCIMLLFFGKVRDTRFGCTINLVFPRFLFFIFFKVTKNNFIVFNKICHVYPTVQQLCSKAHQLVKISIIVNCWLFYFTLYISNLHTAVPNSSFL